MVAAIAGMIFLTTLGLLGKSNFEDDGYLVSVEIYLHCLLVGDTSNFEPKIKGTRFSIILSEFMIQILANAWKTRFGVIMIKIE